MIDFQFDHAAAEGDALPDRRTDLGAGAKERRIPRTECFHTLAGRISVLVEYPHMLMIAGAEFMQVRGIIGGELPVR